MIADESGSLFVGHISSLSLVACYGVFVCWISVFWIFSNVHFG